VTRGHATGERQRRQVSPFTEAVIPADSTASSQSP
jgi:hypothetical protein